MSLCCKLLQFTNLRLQCISCSNSCFTCRGFLLLRKPLVARTNAPTPLISHSMLTSIPSKVFRIVDRRTLLQNSENSLKTISLDTPTLLYSTPNKHYVKYNNGRTNTIISTNSRTRMMANNPADVFANACRRRTHFMDSCLRDYHLMLKAADAEMENAIKQMPLSKWE